MPSTQTFASSSLPTAAYKQFREAQETQDFARACRAASRIFLLTAQQLERQHSCHKAQDTPPFDNNCCQRGRNQDAGNTIPPDLAFWPRLADRAQRAACLHQVYMQHGHSTDALCARLRRENLREFADALESGNYGDLCY